MKVIYVSTIELPSNQANRIQVLHVSNAFSRLVKNFALFLRSYKDLERTRKEYGIRNFRIVQFPTPHIPFLQTLLFILRVFPRVMFEKPDFLYIREPLLAALFSYFFNVAFELHKKDDTFVEKISYSILAKRAKCIFVINKTLEDIMRKYCCKVPLHTEPDGAPIEQFKISASQKACRKICKLPLNKKIIGYVGMLQTMSIDKGFEHTLRALKELKKTYDDFIFIDVGVLPKERPDLEKKINKYGLSKHVILKERVPYTGVPVYLKSCDVLIIPYPWHEHFAYYMSPLKLFEYMASNVPIVSSDLPAITQILTNNKNAALYKHDDSPDFARALQKTLSNHSFASAISRQALKDVEQYSWKNRTKRMLKVMQKCAV